MFIVGHVILFFTFCLSKIQDFIFSEAVLVYLNINPCVYPDKDAVKHPAYTSFLSYTQS